MRFPANWTEGYPIRMKIAIPETIEEWNARSAEYLPGTIGARFISVEPTEVVAQLDVRTSVLALTGFLHAGTVVTLADTCCGYGTLRSLPHGADGFTTIDLSSNLVGTARSGRITCRATPLHQGRSTQIWDATVVSDSTNKAIAHFRCSQLILWPQD